MKKLKLTFALVIALLSFTMSCNMNPDVAPKQTTGTLQSAETEVSTATSQACDPAWVTQSNMTVYCDQGTVYVTCKGGTPASKTITAGHHQLFTRKNATGNLTVTVCWNLGGGYNYYHITPY
jgi:hypothetical protein